ncbi:hypothetical protein [Paraflavitalea pollutisoli]|uniref:hypothetical protein n=1 Tax=Paraflavitalea pollutisoli TaxID=3034143 RepID=UPI0023EC3F0C|nr:hypothetical protein [Paraflavitalea sp. H1-2-19X]
MKPESAIYAAWLQELVPPQVHGSTTTTRSDYTARNEAEGIACFEKAASRLLDVNHWQQWAGQATAAFQLIDARGHKADRPAQEGDYFCIDLPGPGNPGGKGDDWVQVEKIGKRTAMHQQAVYITVRAARSPIVPQQAAPHFFDSAATSTFVVYREAQRLIAAVYGRNEHPNIHQGNLLTRLRNWFVYLGARLGLSALQWKSLTNGLLRFEH